MSKSFDSPLVGQWYPADPATLRNELAGFLPAVEKATGLRGLIVPHAGYRYSGSIAGAAYARVNPADFDRVLILAPSHHSPLADSFSLPDANVIATPLGPARFDDACGKLRTLPQHAVAEHRQEHSHQIQLPFLQVLFGENLRVIPLLIGRLSPRGAAAIAATLAPVLTPRTLLVVSTDFTHFGAQFGYVPFTRDIQPSLRKLDHAVFNTLATHDPEKLEEIFNATHATVCGHYPLNLMLRLLPATTRFEETAYDTSGHMLNDDEHSVSYLSALILDDQKRLSESERQTLLAYARQTLENAMWQRPAPATPPFDLTPALTEKRGGFVTLHTRGHALRGCIGEILPQRPLWQVVRDRTRSAALEDPRFPPVKPGELGNLQIEISALTPPVPAASWRDIEIGRHGILFSLGPHAAVFLPQVPTEQNWALEETLTHLAMKAGLAPGAWRDSGARFDVFEADVFGEHEGG